VLELDNDVYEEVVKPLLEKSKPDLEFGFFTRPSANLPPKKRAQIISIMSKLTLVIIDCLFHNYSISG